MRAAAALSFIGGLMVAATLHAETWRFVAIGDTPYSSYERREFPRMLGQIAAESPDLIIHAGDIKYGSSRCTDALFADRRALFDASPVPFVFVPGDNEWTDCKGIKAGHYDPVERLDTLRRLFFAEPVSLGQSRIPLERQSDGYPEHLMFRLGPVLFVTLNVPGPDNNYGIAEKPRAEFLRRNPAVIAWLRRGFSAARADGLRGIVIVMQADIGFRFFEAGMTHRPFQELFDTLRSETLDFPGQVLLVHGDTHYQRIDQPMRHPQTKRTVENFTRLETFGFPYMGWVKVHIDADAPSLFRFETRAYQPQ